MPVGGAGHCLWYSREYRWAENVIIKTKTLGHELRRFAKPRTDAT